jgi:FkbM family methyltransferase
MSKFTSDHFQSVCLSNDPGVDPFDLIKSCVTHHAQPNDNRIVSEFFDGVTGKFLSIGANNGLDQTYELLIKGWTGVYCEPDPFACAKLIETTKNFKDQVTILNCAITPTGGVTEFFLALGNSFVSSLSLDWIDNHVKNSTTQKIITHSLAFSQVLAMFDYDFDYIQTDTEGYDIQIIESLDWSLVPTCKMICTEAGPAVLKQLCQQGEFMITDITATNSFYKHKKFVLSL